MLHILKLEPDGGGRLQVMITKVSAIHPEGGHYICTQFHGNHADSDAIMLLAWLKLYLFHTFVVVCFLSVFIYMITGMS